VRDRVEIWPLLFGAHAADVTQPPADPLPENDQLALVGLSRGPLRTSELRDSLKMSKSELFTSSNACCGRGGLSTRSTVPAPHGGGGVAYVITLTEAEGQVAASLSPT
jgi:hypothetical protein